MNVQNSLPTNDKTLIIRDEYTFRAPDVSQNHFQDVLYSHRMLIVEHKFLLELESDICVSWPSKFQNSYQSLKAKGVLGKGVPKGHFYKDGSYPISMHIFLAWKKYAKKCIILRTNF